MLAFALSLDDFIITLFNAGSRITYPLYVYGARRAAFPAADQRARDGDPARQFSILLGATITRQRRPEWAQGTSGTH